jgi:hypothetical protein
MGLMQSFDAILFPADGRPPHVVSLMTSLASFSNPHTPAQMNAGRVRHPEVHMEYIVEDPNTRAWHYLVRAAAAPRPATLSHHTRPNILDCRGAIYDEREVRKPTHHLLPCHPRDGMPFFVNRTVRDIQCKGCSCVEPETTFFLS